MAELVSKLRLDTSQYNSGLDSAKQKTKEFQKTADDASKSINDFSNNGSRSAKDILAAMKQQEGAARSMSNYRRQLSLIMKEIQDLTINYRAMSSEMKNSDLGREAALKISELTKKAGEYKDAILDAQQSISAIASDTAVWDATKQGIQALSGALQGVAAAGILSEKSTEGLVKVIAKLKAIEGATNAVIQVGNALQKQSALMMGVARVQSAALTKAKTLEAAATTKATVAQKAFNLVAKANPYVLLATAALAVISALVIFTRRTKEATKAQEEENKKIEEGKKRFEDYKSTVGSAVGNVVGKFKALQRSYQDLSGEMEKQKWIEKNKTAFEQLGLKIQSVNDADRIFNEQSEQVIKALKARAKAAALQSMYEKEYQKQIEAEIEAQEILNNAKNKNVKKSGGWQDDWTKAGLGKGDYKSFSSPGSPTVGGSGATTYELTPEGEAKMKAYYEKLGKEAGDSLVTQASNSIALLEQKWIDAEKDAATESSKVQDLLTDGTKTTTTGGSKPETPYKNQLDILKQQKSELEEQKKYIEYGSDEWKKQLEIIDEIDKKIKHLEEGEKGYLTRIRNAQLGAIEPVKGIQGKVEGPKQQIVKPLSNEDKVQIYKNVQEMAAKYQEYFDLGLITSDMVKQLEDALNDELKSKNIKADIKLDLGINVDKNTIADSLRGIVDSIDDIGSVSSGIVGSINSVYEALSGLGDKLDEAENGWESFFAVFEAGMTVLSSVASIIEAVATITEILGVAKTFAANATKKDTKESVKNAIAKTAEAQAEITAAAAAGAAASGEAASSVASIPYVGPILAVAAAASVIAAIIAVIASAKKFAAGGIFNSNSRVGDHGWAKLNDGEMVLNDRQQKNLFKMLNEGQTQKSDSMRGNVTFTIHGQDLVGVFDNINKKNRKI